MYSNKYYNRYIVESSCTCFKKYFTKDNFQIFFQRVLKTSFRYALYNYKKITVLNFHMIADHKKVVIRMS